MSKPIKVACSPLTKKIYAGTLVKNNTMWGKNKQDVTTDCLLAVIEHALAWTGTVQLISTDGDVDFEVQVKDLRGTK